VWDEGDNSYLPGGPRETEASWKAVTHTTHMKDYIEKFIRAYKVAALWSSTDDQGEPLDTGRDLDDISGDTHNTMDRDCAAFVEQNWNDLQDLEPEQCGHDFWLTRCGHGAGYWDRGLEELGDRLTAACGHGTNFPNIDLYVGDDGLIYA
jgi:hypothetical protein